MTCVVAPSRLHFGLLHLPGRKQEQTDGLVVARTFGSVGLMVAQPGVRVSATAAPQWSAMGPSAGRALAFAHAFVQAAVPRWPGAFQIAVESCPAEHIGLGTGTQLALAVAAALAPALHVACSAVEMGQMLGRGARSALGIHGFAQGGFLVDGGKGPATEVAPLLARCDFPADWAVVLVLPRAGQGVHGAGERDAFADLAAKANAPDRTDVLCRLVLLGMLPALAEKDLAVFGEALYEFNRRVGEAFRPVQGGIYAHPQAEAAVHFFRGQGVQGVGQSSWGPTLFAVAAADHAAWLQEQYVRRQGDSTVEVVLARGQNTGAALG